MRIRSIRPEFWRSDDIERLDWHARLLFIGLWSYVDDNGVGRDKLAEVAADLFAADLSRDPRETLERVSEGLQALVAGGQITRYTIAGRAYLYVTAWRLHQKIDKPGRDRYPLPTSGNAHDGDALATPSRESIDMSAPGEGEKGRRGEGEEPPARAISATHADALVAEWKQASTKIAPGDLVADVWQRIERMFAEGIGYDDVRGGLQLWLTKGLAASVLSSCVLEFQRGGKAKAKAKPTPTERLSDIAAMTAELEAEQQRAGRAAIGWAS